MDCKTILGSAVASAAVVAVSVPAMVNFVGRQATTPGIAEAGHSNISGNSIAGRFGAGVTPTTARVQISEPGGLIGMRSVTSTNDAINALTATTTGSTVTGRFVNSSSSGKAVLGENISTTGATFGGDFKARSTTGGAALLGRHLASSGPGVGVSGSSASSNGVAGSFLNSKLTNGALIGGPGGSLLTKGERPRHQYTAGTSSTMVALAYGVVLSDGSIGSGTGNFTVTKVSAGRYDIDVQGISFNSNQGTVVATPFDSAGDQVTTVANPTAGDIRINSYNVTTNALADSKFYFIIYLAEENVIGSQGPDTFQSPPMPR